MALINSFVGGILAADIIIKGNKCVTHGHILAGKNHIHLPRDSRRTHRYSNSNRNRTKSRDTYLKGPS